MSTVREALAAFKDCGVRAAIEETAFKHVKDDLKTARINNPFSVPLSAANDLETLGIATDPYAIRLHTHGADKAIENRLLEIVGRNLPKDACTLLYLKPVKLQYLRRGPQQGDAFINKVTEPRDLARYPPETVRKQLSGIRTQHAVLSDTMHYLKPRQIVQLFEDNPALQTLHATVVLPPEALHGHPSLHPEIYTLTYHFGGFQYLPGGHGGGFYSHAMEDLEWLSVGAIEMGDRRLTFQKVESLAAHHYYIVHRGHLRFPSMYHFEADTMVSLPQIFSPAHANPTWPLRKTLAMQLFLYSKSIKQVTERDIYAKVRQIIKTSELHMFNPTQLVHIANFFLFVSALNSVNDYPTLVGSGVFRRITTPVKAKLAELAAIFTGKTQFQTLLELTNWTPFTYALETRVVRLRVGTQPFASSTRPQPGGGGPAGPGDKKPTLASVTEHLLSKELKNRLEQIKRGPTRSPEPRPQPPEEPVVSTSSTSGVDTPASTTPCSDSGVNEAAGCPEGCYYCETDGACTDCDGSEQPPPPDAPDPDEWPMACRFELPTVALARCLQSVNRRANAGDFRTEEHDALIPTLLPFLDLPVPTAREAPPGSMRRQAIMARVELGANLTGFCRNLAARLERDRRVAAGEPCPSLASLIPPRKPTSAAPPRATSPPRSRKARRLLAREAGRPRPAPPQTAPPREPAASHVPPATSPEHREPTPPPATREPTPEDSEPKAAEAAAPREPTPPPATRESISEVPEPETASATTSTAPPASPPPSATAIPELDELAAWRPILQASGFGQITPQEGPSGTIYPIERIKQPKAVRARLPALEGLTDKLVSLGRAPRLVPLEAARASAYSSDIKNQLIGALTKNQPREWLRSFAERCETAELTVALSVIHGAGGSGKSFSLEGWARAATPGAFTIVTPTVELRNHWVKKLPRTPEADIKTYEKALVQPANDVVIFDDYGKLPAGYIEAYAVAHQSVTLFVLTGDYKQSVHFETNDDAKTAALTPAIDVFDQHCDYYLNATHRNARRLANALGVCGLNHIPLRVAVAPAPVEGWPILVPGTKKKNALAEAETRAMTYAGCQGLTAPKVNIMIDNATQHCSERVLYTALSRAVDEICFVSTAVDSDGFWDKMSCTPYLKTFLTFVRETEDVEPEPPAEPEPVDDPAPRTHLPVDPASVLLDDYIDPMPDKHDRELYTSAYGHTNAIQTEDPVVQLFMHHQAKDEALMQKTMAKRITISNPVQNEREYILKKDIGDVLFANYRRAMKLPATRIPFDQDLWTSCRAEVERTYSAKTVQQLVNGKARQSPDFDVHKIELFLKSQWVKKTEKLGCLKVKEGQTIASFMQETVMLYGTMARYMRRQRLKYQPKNIFINSEQTPDQLNAWLDGWDFDRPAATNDFVNYDQSQDGAMLQFEVIKAQYHSIPEDVIVGYKMIKMNAFIFAGVLAIMRLSGEGPTYDANTECNIAYNHTRFSIPDDVHQAYGGDDSAQDFVAPEKPSFAAFRDRLTLESKPVQFTQSKGDYATFCSWTFTPHGIVKDPLKLYSSLQLGLHTGKANDLMSSYNSDAYFAYRLGDKLMDVFSEEQLRYTFSVNRILHRHGYQPGASRPELRTSHPEPSRPPAGACSKPDRKQGPLKVHRGFVPRTATANALVTPAP
nr:MAG: replicase [Xinjiang sediment alphaflexi-like virus 1]